MTWGKARKKPVVVDYRYVEIGEEGVETLEGYKSCSLDRHFIIKGVNGEIYPIRRDIFWKTYDVLQSPNQKEAE